MFVLDSHCDTPSQLLNNIDLRLDNVHSQVDLPKLLRGGIDASFFAIYTSAELDSEAARARADEMLDRTHAFISANKDAVALALSPEEALENKAKGKLSICIGMENGSPIGDSLELLEAYYKRGIRYLTLCHSKDNLICDSCAEGGRWGGLSPFGRKVVAEMNRLGIIVDVSHISDESFYDCLEYSSAPIVATHSCCRALASHPRNMTDDMIRRLAEKGGVIQINFYPVFLDDRYAAGFEKMGEAAEGLPGVEKLVDHIDHAVEIAGIDHVGIGSDFDGIEVAPKGLEDVSKMNLVFDELRRRGYSEIDIEKIAGTNFLRVWNSVISLSNRI